ncbi:hypothetical protein DICPUDRAFT_53490 [Dictyostelium purpureum]|uniref:AMP-dependent synthetase/ligase domain-containing protein n=1 Tax=Dictyostelium purpureum TaxID=5786 RepID=F0ZD51_DICPU|nr:uncharacterized protein DICPUDRAFT_53490 [Dictyostelium purpureum]EGC38117.1 hypothetical protein DICPUDRAFT_53490 [Dictyostelium purpureum]|eukprot:XP_003285331.1 hypothetical protein DICPUDRAFT_53490 [Dictyostelium purpureum]
MLNNSNYKLSDPFNYFSYSEYASKDSLSFWDEASKKFEVHWDKPYDKVLDYNSETKKTEWFKGGLINACYNALDKHIKNGKKDEIAFVHEIPIKDIKITVSYQQLYDKVCIFSRALKNLGVKKGDVVLIYMHSSIETITAMLSCARIGAIHCVMYSGALSDNLKTVINDCNPSVIVSSNFGYFVNETPTYFLPILREALSGSPGKTPHVIVLNRKGIPNVDYNDPNLSNTIIEGCLDWEELVKDLEPLREHEPVESQHPLYLIYSSGTTNKPKGIVRETGGYVVAMNYANRMHCRMNDGDSMYSAASFGWISSHSFLIYGMLFIGARSAFHEGPYKSYPNDLWDIISRNKANLFLLSPTQIKRIRKIDPKAELASKYDLSNVRYVIVGSERVEQSIIDYLYQIIKKPILNEYWQTEIGWQMIHNPLNQFPLRGDSIGKVAAGFQVRIVTHSQDNPSNVLELGPNEIGEIVIKLPVPPGVTTSLFGDNKEQSLYKHHYLNKFEGYYSTGDLGYYDNDGYFFFISRDGDSITCGNSSINCSVMELEILNNPQISECCIIGIKDELLSETPMVLLVLNNNNQDEAQIENIKKKASLTLQNIMHTNTILRPIVLCVNSLPRNRNGKVLKPLVKSIFNGENYTAPSTIEDSSVIDDLLEQYKRLNQSN